MIRSAVIALAWSALLLLAAAPARAQSEGADGDLDEDLEAVDEELDEAFRDWGELDDEPARPAPGDGDGEPDDDPRADMPPAFYDAQTWPLAEVERPLALGPGMFEIRATAAAELSAGRALDPVSFAPDVHYGVTERFEIGLLHTRFASLGDDAADEVAAVGSHAPAGPLQRAGDGVCFGDACARFYDNVGVEARVALGAMRGPIQLRVSAGMEAARFDPLRIGARAGVTGRLRAGPVAVLVDPGIRVGLVRRGLLNDDVVTVPVTLQLQTTRRIVVELSSGVYGPTRGLRDGARVPASIGALAALSPAIDVGGSFGFTGIVGGEDALGASERTASLFVAYRL